MNKKSENEMIIEHLFTFKQLSKKVKNIMVSNFDHNFNYNLKL